MLIKACMEFSITMHISFCSKICVFCEAIEFLVHKIDFEWRMDILES